MKFFLGSLITIIFLISGGALFVWSGRYNVAATSPHFSITAWLLEKARDRSIALHSKGIDPPSLKEVKLVNAGFREYHEMCRSCHGAPGYPPTQIAEGLNPKPPKLAMKEIQARTNAEIYWVMKNGIKMTGMPAFGPTHDENELWSIVAFIRVLPNLQNGDYGRMAKEAGFHGEKENHHHGPGRH